MRSAERLKANVLEVVSLVAVSPMDKVKNGEVRRRTGIQREFQRVEQIREQSRSESRVDQRVFRLSWHLERTDYGQKVVEDGSGWNAGTRETDGLGWMDGAKVAFGNRGMTMRERSERVESIGTCN